MAFLVGNCNAGRPLDILKTLKQCELNDIKDMFHMDIIAKQKHLLQKKTIHLHVSVVSHPYLFSGIYEMPTEINRIIMSFLKNSIRFTLVMSPDRNYPCAPLKWNFATCANSSQVLVQCLRHALERENHQFTSDWAAAWTPATMCLVLFMRLKKDLTSILKYL